MWTQFVVGVNPGHFLPSSLIEVPTTKLEGIIWVVQCIIRLAILAKPNTGSPEARLEALNPNNGKKQPEEANEEGNMDKQWCCLFKTPNDNLVLISTVSDRLRGQCNLQRYRWSAREDVKSGDNSTCERQRFARAFQPQSIQGGMIPKKIPRRRNPSD